MCVSFFETQCERDDNQMRDDWNKYNHSGEVFSRGQMFFYFIPDLFTVQKVVICDPTIHTHKSITFLPRHTIFTISRAEPIVVMIYKGFISIMISNIEIILRHYLKL